MFAFWYFWAVKSAKQFAKYKKSPITEKINFFGMANISIFSKKASVKLAFLSVAL